MAGVTILSGPIGAGKTTVAKDLIGLWPAPLAYVEGDRFWPFLVKPAAGDPRERLRVVMRAMTSAAGSMARAGYDVLVDFSVPPPFVPVALRILKDTPLDYVVLRPPLAVCEARARNRAEGKIAKYDPGFYALFSTDERHIIGEEGESPKATADMVFKGLAEGRFRVATTPT